MIRINLERFQICRNNFMMAEKIYYVVYVSSAIRLMTRDQLLELLTLSRKANSRLGITGILLHKDGNFMQMIEGPEEATRGLVEKIKKDPRHRGFIQLIEGYAESRQFADWSMSFYELNSPDTKLVPGFNEFLNTPLTAAEFESDPTRCQRLLLSFRKTTATHRT